LAFWNSVKPQMVDSSEFDSGPHPAAAPRGLSDEAANLLTHAAGLVLSVVATAALLIVVRRQGDVWQIVGCSIYGATLVSLYAASTLSHSFQNPRLRLFFRLLDQVCIFLLIAGTYTPFALAYLREGWWWLLLASIWGMAALGIFFKIFFRRMNNVATAAYVIMGWLPALAVRPISQRMPDAALAWILAGGVLYTVGTIFLSRDERVRYFHALWHLFVIAASACHWVAVMYFVVPWPK